MNALKSVARTQRVKQLLIDHFDDQIQFVPNKRTYESDMFLSSSIDASE